MMVASGYDHTTQNNNLIHSNPMPVEHVHIPQSSHTHNYTTNLCDLIKTLKPMTTWICLGIKEELIERCALSGHC